MGLSPLGVPWLGKAYLSCPHLLKPPLGGLLPTMGPRKALLLQGPPVRAGLWALESAGFWDLPWASACICMLL